ncbi:hypothetical protein NEMIN01_0146 [Nematocida minor]|uniref:uncharacterized protein n=1 Tax=Nematocida minor TaxID=1912983 RepID=UPI0022207651|nr:uncharacterized protein NEMIN01_0042 [Nematocida minor]XP_051332048.1 uncharacterized protein NEMIN01_0146 [Nematocida minor]KAI5188778.1 hypothetical protein NEMIN01_0042 [Nematocida minor]KAI5188882.1 hypothetical protein NEMIN01_0146 [Nematocida minor]
MASKKEEVIRNEILYNTLAKLQPADGTSTNQISYVVKRANLSSTVVLAAISLLLSAKEKLPKHIGSLKRQLSENKSVSLEILENKIETAQSLCSSTYMLFSISLIISSKYLIDRSYINRTWSNILMIDRSLVNEYERCMLEVLEYKVSVNSKSIDDLWSKMNTGPAKQEKKENKIVRSIKKIVSCLFKNE